jgi:hypothetical protein
MLQAGQWESLALHLPCLAIRTIQPDCCTTNRIPDSHRCLIQGFGASGSVGSRNCWQRLVSPDTDWAAQDFKPTGSTPRFDGGLESAGARCKPRS